MPGFNHQIDEVSSPSRYCFSILSRPGRPLLLFRISFCLYHVCAQVLSFLILFFFFFFPPHASPGASYCISQSRQANSSGFRIHGYTQGNQRTLFFLFWNPMSSRALAEVCVCVFMLELEKEKKSYLISKVGIKRHTHRTSCFLRLFCLRLAKGFPLSHLCGMHS